MRMIGVDIGGTFTDLVFADLETGAVSIHKTPTTTGDPAIGMVEGMTELCRLAGATPESIDRVLHGTTIATNAVLEHAGVEAGMITTEGYRDILHIGRHQRPQHYSIRQEIPWQDRPLVRRRNRRTVAERLTPPRGEVLTPLDEAGVRAAAEAFKADGVDAIAICFLFSYLNPAHEHRAAEIVRAAHPAAYVSCSADVSPQFREFERFTTAAMNVYIGPKVRDYVARIAETMAATGFGADLLVMASNGGMATAAMVAEKPVSTLLSGPAAGVMGGAWSGGLAGRDRLITFDVGGTSADIGLVIDGAFAEATARDTWIGGFPVMTPMIDIHTIGAGGGSIAHVDTGGGFRVGPASAGATPGPAAYGRGGEAPTVTDAHVALGRLDPENFLGGAMSLDVAAADAVISKLAAELGLESAEAASGVLAIANANMANAIHTRTVQKGLDTRDFSLVAFGGAGPLHGAEVARLLGIPEVIVPPYPGITSAVGLLTTDLKYDAIRTAFQTSTDLDMDAIGRAFEDMQAALDAQLAADGVAPEDRAFERAGDLRYVGQGYELRAPFPAGAIDAAAIQSAFDSFAAAHRDEYGHDFPESPIEIVNVRLTAIGRTRRLAEPAAPAADGPPTPLRSVDVMFRQDGALEKFTTPVYARAGLPAGVTVAGPAIVVQTDTTTVVPPQSDVTADTAGNLIIRLA